MHCVECDFFLKIKLDSKSRDPLWQIIALRIYSHARWVILFQDLAQLVAERHGSLRPWYLSFSPVTCMISMILVRFWVYDYMVLLLYMYDIYVYVR